MKNIVNNNTDITQKEIDEIINLDKEDSLEDNKIEIDEDTKENNKNLIINNENGGNKLEILEKKVEYLYIQIYNELIPKMQSMIKSINELKDLMNGNWNQNLLMPIIEQIIKDNSNKIKEMIIEKDEKFKNLKNENEDIISEEESESDNNRYRRFNFLIFSTNKEEMDTVFKKYKNNKYLIEMTYTENKENGDKYYILGKFTKPQYININKYQSIIIMDESRNYKKSKAKYIIPNRIIAEFPEKAEN